MSYKKWLANQKISVEDYRSLIRSINSLTSWKYAGIYSNPIEIKSGRVFKLPEGYLVVSRHKEYPNLKELGCIDLIPFKLCVENNRVILRVNKLWLKGKAYSVSKYRVRKLDKNESNPKRLWKIWLYHTEKVIKDVRTFLKVCKIEPTQKRAFNKIVRQEAWIYLNRFLGVKSSTANKWIRYELTPKLLRVRN